MVSGTIKSKDLHSNELALQTSELKQQLASQLGDADRLGRQNEELELSLTKANACTQSLEQEVGYGLHLLSAVKRATELLLELGRYGD